MLYKSIQYSVMALGGLCGHLTDWLIKSFFCGSLSKRCHPFGRRKTTVVPESGWMQDASSPAIVWDKNHQVVVRGFLKHWTSIFDGLGIDLDSLSHVDYVGHMWLEAPCSDSWISCPRNFGMCQSLKKHKHTHTHAERSAMDHGCRWFGIVWAGVSQFCVLFCTVTWIKYVINAMMQRTVQGNIWTIE